MGARKRKPHIFLRNAVVWVIVKITILVLHSDHLDSTDPNTSEKLSCHVGRNKKSEIINREKAIVAYAFIDDGADVTMLDWNVSKNIGFNGKREQLELS